MPPDEIPNCADRCLFQGRELSLFQDVLERLLAPDLGPLRRHTHEIADWVLEAYLSSSLPDKVQAYVAARQASREAIARLRASGPGGAFPARRRARLLQDLSTLDQALADMLALIRKEK